MAVTVFDVRYEPKPENPMTSVAEFFSQDDPEFTVRNIMEQGGVTAARLDNLGGGNYRLTMEHPYTPALDGVQGIVPEGADVGSLAVSDGAVGLPFLIPIALLGLGALGTFSFFSSAGDSFGASLQSTVLILGGLIVVGFAITRL